MGDKSPKSKQRDQAQKTAAKSRAKKKSEKRQEGYSSRADAPAKK